MTRACANCGKPIETDCTEEQCPNYYCSDECVKSSEILERIIVGQYTITKYKNGDFWISHESGEGMQVFRINFEKLIDEFYKAEF